MKDCLLGLDVGTSSVKAALIDANADVLCTASASYRLLPGPAEYRQIDTNDMWRAILSSIRQIGQEHNLRCVRGIGISCLCPGLSALDADGNTLVDPIIYSDQRSISQVEDIKRAVDMQELFSLTANTPMPGAMSATSMLWIRDNLPEQYNKTAFFGHVNTLVAARMTGSFAVDPSNASYTLLFETTGSLQWSDRLCQKLGIPMDKLPPILPSTAVVGHLKDSSVIAAGLSEGTPVVIGGGDTACASLAAGIMRDGDICESTGTTDVLTVCTQIPAFRQEYINRCHVVPGAWLYQGAMSHIGSSLSWCRDTLCPDLVKSFPQANPYDVLTSRAWESSCAGANGLVFLPYMMGERSPVWDPYARGVFFGVTLSSTRDDMVRAVLEAPGYGLRQMLQMVYELRPLHTAGFCVIGGGAKSVVWNQIKADIIGAEITALDIQDMAPIGAALLCGVGVGIFDNVYSASDAVQRRVLRTFRPSCTETEFATYLRRYDTYTKLYPQLKNVYRSNHDV